MNLKGSNLRTLGTIALGTNCLYIMTMQLFKDPWELWRAHSFYDLAHGSAYFILLRIMLALTLLTRTSIA